MTLFVGNNLVLARNTGTNASPTWVTVSIVGDVELSGLSVVKAGVDLRSSAYKLSLPGKFEEFTISVALANHIGNTVFDALRTAFFAKTINQYAVANGGITTSGTQGFKAFCFISEFPWSQPIGDLGTHAMVLSGAWYEESSVQIEPAWFTAP